MKIYQHCESDKKLWLNTRSLLKHIEILKIHLSQTRFVMLFSSNPKNMRVKLLWCSAWLSHQLWSYAFSEWRHPPLLYLHWYNIYLVQLQLTKYLHLQQISELILPWRDFFLFTFYFCSPLDCAMYQATLVVKTEKFQNGRLSGGKSRLNFCNFFCESWCDVLK